MTHLPNIITSLRIAGSLGLLFCDVTGVLFWIIYALCGISDIADGRIARKLKCVTRKGDLLDTWQISASWRVVHGKSYRYSNFRNGYGCGQE